MKAFYQREQRHICGKHYMEVDLYDVTAKQHSASRRAKRKEATRLSMQKYNDNNAVRHRVQVANTNFTEDDFFWTGTYDDEHIPAVDDRKKVDRDLTNYIKRIYRWCDSHSVPHPKWMGGTEYATRNEDGTVLGRHHHHVMIQRVPGLTREVLEDLWRDSTGNRIGFTRAESLEFDKGSIEAVVRYVCKNKRCDRNWRQSRGLQMPKCPRPNDTKWSRRKLHDASTLYIDDRSFWEKQYPGYTLSRVTTSVTVDGMRHTVAILHSLESELTRKKKYICNTMRTKPKESGGLQ